MGNRYVQTGEGTNSIINCSRYGEIHNLNKCPAYRKNSQKIQQNEPFYRSIWIETTKGNNRTSYVWRNWSELSLVETRADSIELVIRKIAKK